MQVDSFPSGTIYAVYFTKMCFLHKCDTNVNYKNVGSIKNYENIKKHLLACRSNYMLAYFLSGFSSYMLNEYSRDQITYKIYHSNCLS